MGTLNIQAGTTALTAYSDNGTMYQNISLNSGEFSKFATYFANQWGTCVTHRRDDAINLNFRTENLRGNAVYGTTTLSLFQRSTGSRSITPNGYYISALTIGNVNWCTNVQARHTLTW
jgi:hypothetical protein